MAKVVHFAKYFLPDVGGIESVVPSLACSASNVGHFAAIIYYRKTLFGRGPKLTAVHNERHIFRK